MNKKQRKAKLPVRSALWQYRLKIFEKRRIGKTWREIVRDLSAEGINVSLAGLHAFVTKAMDSERVMPLGMEETEAPRIRRQMAPIVEQAQEGDKFDMGDVTEQKPPENPFRRLIK